MVLVVSPSQVADLFVSFTQRAAIQLGFVNPAYVETFPFPALQEAKK
jgi:hypothetical protein